MNVVKISFFKQWSYLNLDLFYLEVFNGSIEIVELDVGLAPSKISLWNILIFSQYLLFVDRSYFSR